MSGDRDLEHILAKSFVRRVEFHPVLASTNDRALQLSRQHPLEAPFLVLAGEQTAGRGRGENRWWSEPGALTFSLIIEPGAAQLRPDQWPRVALTAGVAVCEVLEQTLPQVSCALKWPNDVLLDDRKVCGILAEPVPGRNPFPSRLVVGLGINVNNSLIDAPADIRERGTALCDVAGKNFVLADILLDILRSLEANLQALATNDPRLPQEWQRRCFLRGKTVSVNRGPNAVRGVCHGIDAEGALLIETDHRRERLFGGTIESFEENTNLH